MSKLELIVEPDPRYNRISDRLRQPSDPVGDITDELQQLAEDMFETMIEEQGVGLAAPQVGRPIRLIVANIPAGYGEGVDEDVPFKLFNPEIVKAGGREEDLEGCLSFPELLGPVERYTWAIIKGQDVEGNKVRFRARGIVARVLQHEIDHLNGTLFFDRMEHLGMLFYPSELESDDDQVDAAVTA